MLDTSPEALAAALDECAQIDQRNAARRSPEDTARLAELREDLAENRRLGRERETHRRRVAAEQE